MTLRPTLAAALMALGLGAAAQAAPVPVATRVPIGQIARLQGICSNMIVQNFPTSGPTQTTWEICWHEVAGSDSLHNPNGLVIGPVYFRPSPGASFIEVMYDMRVSDYFVPYHPGSPRYYDLSFYNFVLTGVTTADCPASAGGTVISPHVCKEVHDRGLMWKDGVSVRRGEEIVLWGAIDAANYRYIQEYTFRDDGFIMGRVGATGQNLPGLPTTTHTHGAYWRLDMDFGGASPNNVAHMVHTENTGDPSGVATDSSTAVATGRGFQWNARQHDALVISNPGLVNGQGHVSQYDLIEAPASGGLADHYEDFTHDDLWVTHYDPGQFAASLLPSYTGTGVASTDVVLWIKATIHHHPRDEDGLNGTGSVNGTADVMWSGWALIPHNLFSCSPFYPGCP
jgi:Cu2+-containing amine oxidase